MREKQTLLAYILRTTDSYPKALQHFTKASGFAGLKQSINKRRDSAAFGKDDKGSEEEEDNDYGQEPEFLPYFHEFPEFFDY